MFSKIQHMNVNIKRLIAFIIIMFSDICFTQQYAFVNFTLEKSLPGNQVWSIFQDSKGFMWFATTAGLIRYDGENYIVYNETNGLTSYFAYNVDEDSKGNVWIGSPAGISKFNTATNQMISIPIGSFNNSYKIFVDSYDRVWIYDFQYPGDVYLYENDSLHNYSYEFNFHKQRILHIEQDNKGMLYLLNSEFKLFKFFTQQFQEVEFNSIVSGVAPRMFFFDTSGDLILCGRRGVAKIKLPGLKDNYEPEWLLKDPVSYGLQDSRGDYWFVSSQSGIYRIHNQEIQNIDETNGLPTPSLLSIYQDRENNLWIGTNLRGILKLSSLRLSHFSKNEGFNDEAILAVFSNGMKKYCATEKGLYSFFEPEFRRINLTKSTDNKPFDLAVLSIAKYSDIYLLGCVTGVYEFNGMDKVKLIGLGGYIVYDILIDSQERIWLTTNDGVYRWTGGVNFVKQDFGVKDIYVNSILEVNSKDIYLATSKGLVQIQNISHGLTEQQTKLFTIKDGLPSENILSLTKDKLGNIIMGTTNGLVIKNSEGEFNVIIDGLSNKVIPTVFVDSKGYLWAGTNHGLHQLTFQNDAYFLKSIFYMKDGLASNEFTRMPTITEDEDERIWFGTYSGLSVYDPNEEPAVFVKPLTYLSELYVNEKKASIDIQSIQEFNHSENKFRIKYQSPSFFDEDNLRFEYYLHPMESPWSNTTNLREITYSFLNPGSYIFRVRTINAFGIAGDVQEWAFKINPPFWRTNLFYFFVIAFLLLTIYLLVKLRLRRIQKNNVRLEKIVKEKTGELLESKNEIAQQYEKLLDAQKQLVEKSKLEKAYDEIKLLKDRLAIENIYLKERQGISTEIESVVGKSAAISKIRQQIIEVAETDTTVLITGPTGTGKNLIAAAIHSLSKRKDRALISVNCAAIPSGLIESELFGHEKGAFTGANEKHIGKFEMANDSTIFLDEIGDMSLPLQSKLLTVLQDKKFTRVGGNKTIEVNTRVIAATNQNLERLVEKGLFRQDLFYRLNVFNINVPSLSERIEDVGILAKYFIDIYAREMNKKVKGITKSAMTILEKYDYPGNVRELESIIQRAIILCKGNTMSDEHIVLRIQHTAKEEGNKINNTTIQDELTLEENERNYILRTLDKTKWKIQGDDGAAKILGVNSSTLRSRMLKLNIPFRREKW